MSSTTLRKILKFAGYPLFFLLLFVLFLLWTFPLDHFKPAVETQLTKLIDRAVHIEDMSMSLTGGVVLSNVEIEVPAEEESKEDLVFDEDEEGEKEEQQADPKKKQKWSYHVDEMVIDVGLLALLSDTLDISIEMDMLGGELSIRYEGPLPSEDDEVRRRPPRRRPRARPSTPRRPGYSPAGLPAADGSEKAGEGEEEEEAEEEEEEEDDEQALALVVEARNIELRQIHDLRSKLPLPITGTLNITIELHSTTGSFVDAVGSILVDASSVVLGSAESEIDVGGMPMTVDPIAITSIECQVEVEEGKAEFSAFDTKSKDFDAEIRGDVTFSDPLSHSRLDLYLMFKFLDGYAAKSQKASMLISSLDDFSRDLKRAHRQDGFYGFRYRGRFGSARLSPSKSFREKRQAGKKRSRRPRDRTRKDRPRAGAAGLPDGPSGVAGERRPPRGGGDGLPGADVRGGESPSGAPSRMERPGAPMPARPGMAGGGPSSPHEVTGGGEEEVEEEEVVEEVDEEGEEVEEEGGGEEAEESEEEGEEEGGEEEAADDEGE